MFKSISDISGDFFKAHSIKYVILDIDNTLVPYTAPKPDSAAAAFFERLKNENIAVCLVSNNRKSRVSAFNEEYGFYALARACKPLTVAIRRAMKSIGAKKEQTALIGDQVFTDVLGGNLAGITTVLVDPIEIRESAFFRFKRKCEKKVLKSMERNKK
jgi:hypothetical protein